MLDNWNYLYGKEDQPVRISDVYLDIQEAAKIFSLRNGATVVPVGSGDC